MLWVIIFILSSGIIPAFLYLRKQYNEVSFDSMTHPVSLQFVWWFIASLMCVLGPIALALLIQDFCVCLRDTRKTSSSVFLLDEDFRSV